jgi:hypothetical protein
VPAFDGETLPSNVKVVTGCCATAGATPTATATAPIASSAGVLRMFAPVLLLDVIAAVFPQRARRQRLLPGLLNLQTQPYLQRFKKGEVALP